MADPSFAGCMPEVNEDEPSQATSDDIHSRLERAIETEPIDDNNAMMPSGYYDNDDVSDDGVSIQSESMADISIDPMMAGPTDDDVDPLSDPTIKTEPVDDDKTMPPGFCIDMVGAPDGFLYITAESTARAADDDLEKPLNAIKTELADDTAVTGVSNGLIQRTDGRYGGITAKEERIYDVELEDEDVMDEIKGGEVDVKSLRVGVANMNRSFQVTGKLEGVAGTSCTVGGRLVTSEIDKPYSCDLCETRFRYAFNLKAHMRIHTGEKPYSCDVCESSFGRTSHLKDHMRTHTGERPYPCAVCNARFREAGHLKSHMKTHTGEKPYSCDVCESRFRHACDLKAHKRIHTGEKPYSCDVCESRFRHACALKVHMRSHTGEKPYPCAVCDSRFKHPSHLKVHMRTHTGGKPYSCDVCESTFSKFVHLKTHKRNHAKEKEK